MKQLSDKTLLQLETAYYAPVCLIVSMYIGSCAHGPPEVRDEQSEQRMRETAAAQEKTLFGLPLDKEPCPDPDLGAAEFFIPEEERVPDGRLEDDLPPKPCPAWYTQPSPSTR